MAASCALIYWMSFVNSPSESANHNSTNSGLSTYRPRCSPLHVVILRSLLGEKYVLDLSSYYMCRYDKLATGAVDVSTLLTVLTTSADTSQPSAQHDDAAGNTG